jgi:FKBP-type peptidyl-prolyl cis-trans isomerase
MNKNFLIAVIVGLAALCVFAYIIFVITPFSSTSSENTTANSDTHAAVPANTKPKSNLPQATELKIEDLKVGDGQEVKSGDTVVMNYVGTLTDGTKFDSSYDRGTPFETKIGVGQVIEGWDKGVVGMKVGGKRRLTIPPSMGYGDQPAGSIPPNSTLIFEVELVSIK